MLKNFILVEKATIAYTHPIIFIIKLRPYSKCIFAFYLRICGYTMVLFQQSGLFLKFLSLNNF